MPTCFVIQPFDEDRFDGRYKDTFAPAIRAADLEPYRVDQDPEVEIPIDEIHSGIEAAAICLADITLDNPNVWYELGYAIAAGRDVVMICSDERKTRYPFDIQHRTVTKYKTGSLSDYKTLEAKIEERLKAILRRREKFGDLSQIQSVVQVEGLQPNQLSALIAVAEQLEGPESSVSIYSISSAMEQMGFSNLATNLGLKVLTMKGMVQFFTDSDWNGIEFTAYRVTDTGMQWLLDNEDKLTLTKEKNSAVATKRYDESDYTPASGPPNDDMPF